MHKIYTEGYSSPILRGRGSDRPWNLESVIKEFSDVTRNLLDIGCGTSSKLLKLADHFNKIYAMDPSPDMRRIALNLISQENIKNIMVIDGKCDALPFEDKFFDVVTCMLAPFKIAEIYRVLKGGGYLIIEAIGDRDKIDLKKIFGKDKLGWRGQNMNFNSSLSEIYRSELSSFFDEVRIVDGLWDTYYTMEGLIELLKETSSIRDFDPIKDAEILCEISKTLISSGEAKLTQNRFLITALKK